MSNSPGAVTAQTLNVQTMEIYQEARHDPVTRQFVSGLRSYVQLMIDRTQQLDQQPYYIFALDDGRGKADDTGNIYMFLATNPGGDELIDHAAYCEVSEGVSVFGFVGRGSVDQRSTNVGMKLLTHEDDPLLQRICRGLKMPVSALLSEGSVPRHGDVNVYDYLSRGKEGVALVLVSARMKGQELEESSFRYYWSGALTLRYHRPPPPSAVLTPEVYGQLDTFANGGWVEGHLGGMPAPMGSSAYPPEARQEFGERLDRLDSDWRDYLKTASVTFGADSEASRPRIPK